MRKNRKKTRIYVTMAKLVAIPVLAFTIFCPLISCLAVCRNHHTNLQRNCLQKSKVPNAKPEHEAVNRDLSMITKTTILTSSVQSSLLFNGFLTTVTSSGISNTKTWTEIVFSYTASSSSSASIKITGGASSSVVPGSTSPPGSSQTADSGHGQSSNGNRPDTGQSRL